MGVFFTSWQLWEEMTFVLACAIVIVFLIGLFKLWQTSRQLRRQEQIDEEKRARTTDLRRAAVLGGRRGTAGRVAPSRKQHRRHGSDIPFGVRAMQDGIQVDGIWISWPTTSSPRPSPRSDPSEVQPGPSDIHRPWLVAKQKERQQQQQDTTAYMPVPMVFDGSSNGLAAVDGPDASSTTVFAPLPKISEDGTLPAVVNTGDLPFHGTLEGVRSSSGVNSIDRRSSADAADEDALQQFEGFEGTYAPTTTTTTTATPHVSTATTPSIDTYIPSSHRRSLSPGPSSPKASATAAAETASGTPASLARAQTDVPAAGGSSSSSNSHGRKHSADSSRQDAGLQQQQRPRVVNPGFEILPAGTFGQAAVADVQGPSKRRRLDILFAPPRNKLQRKPGKA